MKYREIIFFLHCCSLEEKNRYLRKVCHELQEELSSLRKERVALEFKLEKLHSRSPVLVHSP